MSMLPSKFRTQKSSDTKQQQQGNVNWYIHKNSYCHPCLKPHGAPEEDHPTTRCHTSDATLLLGSIPSFLSSAKTTNNTTIVATPIISETKFDYPSTTTVPLPAMETRFQPHLIAVTHSPHVVVSQPLVNPLQCDSYTSARSPAIHWQHPSS
ncbi:unnamed protein product [Schistocephalus solidus]|uniref:Ovule protein n=1 Tax=Schistocephalus solidus TaxID=70667 RepID=A0A183SME6_SCHSO|nr:unnamed protein product [Schistocephalus solidus]